MKLHESISPPLRILWVVSEFEACWSGGIGRVVAGACEALARRGHAVHVAGNAPGAAGEIEGVTGHPWPPRRHKWEQLPRLRRLLRELDPDVVHFHSAQPHGEVIVPLLAWRGRRPRPLVALTPHTGTDLHFPRRFARAALRRADLVLPVSRWSAAGVRAASSPAARIEVVECGIDAPPALHDSSRETVVLSLSSLHRRKGVDLLIEAFDRVSQAFPEWTLVVAGEGTERDALEAEARSLACGQRIRFVGAVHGREKDELLARASLGVVPSRQDNLPGTLIEFQAHGVPAIAAAVGGVPELAGDGSLARLVPPENPGELASALTELMASSAKRAELARAARSASEARSWPRVAARFEAIYRDASSVRRRAHASGSTEKRLADADTEMGAPSLADLKSLPAEVLNDPDPGAAARVVRYELPGGPWVLKEWDPPRGRLHRRFVGFLMSREVRHYRALQGVPGVSRLRAVYGRRAFAVEFVAGHSLDRVLAEKDPELFERGLRSLERTIDTMHARGFCHLDLHHKRNLLVDTAGQAWLLDLAQGLDCSRGMLRRLALPALSRIDRNAVVKFRARYAPHTLAGSVRDAQVARFASRKSRWYVNGPRRLAQKLIMRGGR